MIFYESWAADSSQVSLDDFCLPEFGDDPDRPRTRLTDHSPPQERAGFGPIKLVQSVQESVCIRQFLRDYFADTAGNREIVFPWTSCIILTSISIQHYRRAHIAVIGIMMTSSSPTLCLERLYILHFHHPNQRYRAEINIVLPPPARC